MKAQQNKSVEEIFWNKPVIFVCSFLVAVFIWLFIADPVKQITFNVPINTVGINAANVIEGRDLVLVDNNIPKSIEVTLKGRQSALNKIVKQNFTSIIDFSKIDSEKITKMEIPMPSYEGEMQGVLVDDYFPREFSIGLDNLGDLVMNIDLKQTGQPAEGYSVKGISLIPPSVQLSGSASFIEKVKSAKVTVDVSDMKESEERKVYVKILDEGGKEIKGTEKRYKTIARIDIAKSVPIVPVIEGEPEDGFGYSASGISVKPEYISVYAEAGVNLEELTQVYTKPINITNMKDSTTVATELALTEGYKLVDETKATVRVTIPIDGLETKDFEIRTRDISFLNPNGGVNYTFTKDKVKINIRGPRSVVSKIKASSFNARIDVESYAAGTHKVPLVLTLPTGCSLSGSNAVELTVEGVQNDDVLTP